MSGEWKISLSWQRWWVEYSTYFQSASICKGDSSMEIKVNGLLPVKQLVHRTDWKNVDEGKKKREHLLLKTLGQLTKASSANIDGVNEG